LDGVKDFRYTHSNKIRLDIFVIYN
jgi:hypothetical protein